MLCGSVWAVVSDHCCMQLDAVKLAGKRGSVPAASCLLLSVLVGQLAAALGGTLARVQG
jgi:hypothetical protein